MSTLGRFLVLGVGAVPILATAAYTGDQTILGKSIAVKSKPGDPAKRKVKGSAREKSSTNTLVGDPTSAGGAGGALLTIFANGGTPSVQSFVLNQGTSSTGKPFWSGDAVKGFKYNDVDGEQGAVKSASIRLSTSGSFSIKVSLTGKNGLVSIAPPNPGSDACLAIQLGVDGTSGDRYSVQFGPESKITNNGDVLFRATQPLNEGVCPTGAITTTSTSSTTTITMIDRCCVAGACLRLNPPACFDFGGIPLGDGSCEPNPCPPATTTTTMVGSPAARSDSSLTH
jgi:hypothetical protein